LTAYFWFPLPAGPQFAVGTDMLAVTGSVQVAVVLFVCTVSVPAQSTIGLPHAQLPQPRVSLTAPVKTSVFCAYDPAGHEASPVL
jgi:hypothetical protein